jgi:hypothetical protein
MIALMVFGCAVYLVATEYISAKKSKGEVLLFRRGHVPQLQAHKDSHKDEEAGPHDRLIVDLFDHRTPLREKPSGLLKQTAVFQWCGVTYDIKVKKEERRLLDHIDGWIKPGTLTALMVCVVTLQ